LPVHPTQLYESAAGIALFLLLLVAWTRRGVASGRPGLRFALAVAGYAVCRFAIDFFRGDLAHGRFGLTTSQYLALAALGLVIAWATGVEPGSRPAAGHDASSSGGSGPDPS